MSTPKFYYSFIYLFTYILSVSPAADQAAGAASSQSQRGREGAGAESTTQEQLQGAAQRGEPGPLARPPSDLSATAERGALGGGFVSAKAGVRCRDPRGGRERAGGPAPRLEIRGQAEWRFPVFTAITS